MTTRTSAAPPVVETAHPAQLRTLAAWLKANHMDGWAKVAAESADEIDRLQDELRKKQMFNVHSS
jgi:hypothetical protein